MSFSKKREKEKIAKIQEKRTQESARAKEIKRIIYECASDISSKYGLSETSRKNIVGLIYEDTKAASELPLRITFTISTLEKYGYSREEAISIIDANFSLLRQTPTGLIHCLAIANQYGFDEEYLVNNHQYSDIKENELYSLTEELKSNGVKPTLENVSEFYRQVKKDGKKGELNRLHPLSPKTIFIYRALYDKNMKQEQIVRTK